ncbi:MAG TPA: DUF4912 domain-containing protein [Anaeromyxobacter sp.]|nr:DUF4912 domain-containing protein [Anaeromyxobacter sp.]
MRDLRKMTLEKLRALARKLLGAGHSRLRTKAALVAALERAARKAKQVAQKVGKERAKPTRAARAEKRASAEPTKKPTRKATKPRPPARPRHRAAPPAPPASSDRPADEGSLDPAAFFVARVRGEEAVRGAPHPMSESAAGAPLPAEATGRAPPEEPDELPWSYGEDALVVLPRDPRTLFVYWDHADATLREGFRDLDAPRVELWLYARAGDGWELVRRLPLALESRGYYVHGVDAGRAYRAELRVVDRGGRERLLGPGSGDAEVPPAGPSPIVDDRFERLAWDQPLGPPLGPGHRGPDFPADAREELARLSGWRGDAGEGAPRPWSPGGGPPWGPGEGDR